MKKRFLLLFLALLAFAMGNHARAGETGEDSSPCMFQCFDSGGFHLALFYGVNDSSIKELIIPGEVEQDGVTYTVYAAYLGMLDQTDVETITVSEGVRVLQSINSIPHLKTLNLPASLLSFYEMNSYGYPSLMYLPSLTAINVAEGNKYYTSVDGVLFNKDKTRLLYYPQGLSALTYKVPDGVVEIGCAFSCNTVLESITFPKTTTMVYNNMFYRANICPKLNFLAEQVVNVVKMREQNESDAETDGSASGDDYNQTLDYMLSDFTTPTIPVLSTDKNIEFMYGKYDFDSGETYPTTVYVPSPQLASYFSDPVWCKYADAECINPIPGTAQMINHIVIRDAVTTVPLLNIDAPVGEELAIDKLDFDDNNWGDGISIQEPFFVTETSYTHTFATTDWTSLYLPFPLSASELQKDFDIARPIDVEGNKLYVQQRTQFNNDIIPAYTPLIIKPKVIGEKTFTAKKVTFSNVETEESVIPYAEAAFIGSLKRAEGGIRMFQAYIHDDMTGSDRPVSDYNVEMFQMPADANAGTDFSFHYDSETYTAKLTNISNPSAHVVIPAFVTGDDGMEYEVTNVGNFITWDEGLEDFEVPGTIKSITSLMFDGYPSIKQVTFHHGVQTLGENFRSCDSLAVLNLPATLTLIKEDRNCVFGGLSGLKTINIPDDAKYFKVVDDVLYTADMTELYCYPAKKNDVTFTIPDGVEYLHYAFTWSETLQHIVCPASLTSYCYDLRLPNNTATITFLAPQVVVPDKYTQSLIDYGSSNKLYVPGSLKMTYHYHQAYQDVPLEYICTIPGTEAEMQYDIIYKYDENMDLQPSVSGVAFGDVIPVIDELTIDEKDYHYGIHVDGTAMAKSLTYVRDFDNTDWQPLFVPFDIPVAQLPAGIQTARITGMDNSITVEGILSETGDTLKANYPYLIKSTNTGSQSIVLNNVYVKDLNCYPVYEGEMDIESWYYQNDPENPFPYGAFAWGRFLYQNYCMIEGHYLYDEWSGVPTFRWIERNNYENEPIFAVIEGTPDYALIKALGALQYSYDQLTMVYSNVENSDKCDPQAKVEAVEMIAQMEVLLSSSATTVEDINVILAGYTELYDRLTSEFIPDLGDTDEWIVDEYDVKQKNNSARQSYYITADDDTYFVRFKAKYYDHSSLAFQFRIDGTLQVQKNYTSNQVYEIPAGRHTITFGYQTASNYLAANCYCNVTNISFMRKSDFRNLILEKMDQCLEDYKYTCGEEERSAMLELRAKAAVCELNIDTLDYYMSKIEHSEELENMKRIYINIAMNDEPGTLEEKVYDYEMGAAYDYMDPSEIYKLTVTGSIDDYDLNFMTYSLNRLHALDIQNTTGIEDIPYEFLTDNAYLKEVFLPVGIKSIGDYAFRGTGLNYISMPEGLESIGEGAFYAPANNGNSLINLKGVKLPSTLKTIGNDAFYNSWADATLQLPDGIESIGYHAFYGADAESVVIPANAKLSAAAFEYSKLQRVEFKEGFNFYSDATRVFAHNYSLKELVLPSSVNIIPLEAFASTRLDNVVLPKKMKNIGDRAFALSTVKSIVMPEELGELGDEVFGNVDMYEIEYPGDPLLNPGASNSRFESIKLPETLTELPKGGFERCLNLKEINIPENVTKIPDYAFWLCQSLPSVSLPDRVKSIGRAAFATTKSLESITLPDSVTRIGSESFAFSGIRDITLSDMLENIDDCAFRRADNLKTVTSRSLVPPVVTDLTGQTFPNHSSIKVRVPQWTLGYYARDDFWYDFDLEGYLYEPNVINVRRDITFNINETSLGYEPSLHMMSNDNGKYAALINDSEAAFSLRVFEYVNNTKNLANYNDEYYNRFSTNVLVNNTGKMRADEVVARYKLEPQNWYFISVPFNAKLADITDENDETPVLACYSYSGEMRANGSTDSWVRVRDDGMLEAGKGYIINTKSARELVMRSVDDERKNDIFLYTEKVIPLKTYYSNNTRACNHNWNFIANPYLAFYDVENIGTYSPVVIYDHYYKTYKTISHADGDVHVMYPGESFFIQATGKNDRVVFSPEHRLTYKTKADSGANSKRRTNVSRSDVLLSRSIINLELTNVTDSMTDATRIVINEDASLDYEAGVDAGKLFAPDTKTAQLFSFSDGSLYSLNERPLGDGVVNLGVTFAEAGEYSFAMPECFNLTDYSVYLEDTYDGKIVKMDGMNEYKFSANEGQSIGRFYLHISKAADATDIVSAKMNSKETDRMYDLTGRMILDSTIAHGVVIDNNKKVLKK